MKLLLKIKDMSAKSQNETVCINKHCMHSVKTKHAKNSVPNKEHSSKQNEKNDTKQSKKHIGGISTHYNDGSDWVTPQAGKDSQGRFSTDWLGMKITY